MKKKHQNLLISLLTIFFLFEFLINSNILFKVFFNTINLCFYNILPNIFAFFLITDILNNYHFPKYLSKIIGNLFEKIYHLPKSCAYVVLMSLTSGFPGNSKLIKDQLDNHLIDEFDATKILTMTHFSNPLFIIYTIGNNFLHDQKTAFIILIVHFLTNLIVGFFFRNVFPYKKKDNLSPTVKSMPFITLLKNSFLNTSKLLINILGIIIFFAIVTTTLSKYLNLNPFTNTIITGLMEITNGLKNLSLLNISKIKAAVIATFFLSFGGFSIHMQTMSLLNKYQINYYVYLLARIFHAAISALIVFIIMSYC